MKRTGAQVIWEAVARQGVKHVFGYPGSGITPAFEALLNCPLHCVLARHEQGATHMADGYARAGGGVGVALATGGAGATNMITGIATAMMDSSPIVCTVGHESTEGLGHRVLEESIFMESSCPLPSTTSWSTMGRKYRTHFDKHSASLSLVGQGRSWSRLLRRRSRPLWTLLPTPRWSARCPAGSQI